MSDAKTVEEHSENHTRAMLALKDVRVATFDIRVNANRLPGGPCHDLAYYLARFCEERRGVIEDFVRARAEADARAAREGLRDLGVVISEKWHAHDEKLT